MDVEGYETKALTGLQETLLRDRPPIFMEIQQAGRKGPKVEGKVTVEDLLYPDHLLFQVFHHLGKYVLRPFSDHGPEEALVLPKELAGLVPGTAL
jgi:hypothetical protein